jgi:predicted alpha/beta superfamily hydrolase
MSDTTHPLVTIQNSIKMKYNSKNVDQEFELSISLPLNYNKTEKTYPVLYLLDSNYHFTTTTGIVKFLNEFGSENNLHIPEMIIIGIGYPAEGPDIITYRSRDYTPVEDTENYKKRFKTYGVDLDYQPNSGGAPEFLKFITDELMPYIEENYRVDKKDKTIAGHSYGGLFPSYVLFTKPDTFNKYILLSPSCWYNQEIIFKYEEEYSRNHN